MVKNLLREKIYFIIAFIILLLTAGLTSYYIQSFGIYPWGSDVYGHIYKSNILYDALNQGNWFLNYDPDWYNGLQPYRYWAPLPYYILAIMNLLVKDMIRTYNIFLVVVFVVGGLGFLKWGYYLKRQWLGLFLGILWFFVPINGDIIFAQGNVPFITVNMLIPHIFFLYYKSLRENKIANYLGVSILMAIATLCHAMLAAMIGITMFLYYLFYSISNKDWIKNFFVLFYGAMGVMLASFWLIPALKGGIIQSGSSSTSEYMMNLLTFPFSISLNPFIRLHDKEVFYFGLSFALIAFFGYLFGFKERKSGFIVTILILIGTSKFTLPFLSKLPFNQVFWMTRFTPIAMCLILFSLLMWKELRRSILIFLCVIMVLDSFVSFKLKGFHTPYPSIKADFVEKGAELAVQRIAMLDTSQFGSFPSYYISYQDVSDVRSQVYGWAWQGATTGPNIVQINYALEKGFFGVMFDRSLELGADVLIVRKALVNDFYDLDYWSKKVGYMNQYEDDSVIIYQYDVEHTFGTKVKYDGLALGRYAPNITYLFPNFTVGNKPYLEDYSIDEISQYEAVFISGLDFKDKKMAEDMLYTLSHKGVKVLVDFTGMDAQGIGGVVPQSITFEGNYSDLYYEGEKKELAPFPEEYTSFKTVFLSGKNLINSQNRCILNQQILQYLHKENENLIFVGLNLPYYAVETKDPTAIKMLEESLGIPAYKLPDREVMPVEIIFDKDEKISITTEKNVLIPLAAIDGFEAIEGEYEMLNNLVLAKDHYIILNIVYPYKTIGLIFSMIAIIILLITSLLIEKYLFNNKLLNRDRGQYD
jgi:uncharacterized membrane protein